MRSYPFWRVSAFASRPLEEERSSCSRKRVAAADPGCPRSHFNMNLGKRAHHRTRQRPATAPPHAGPESRGRSPLRGPLNRRDGPEVRALDRLSAPRTPPPPPPPGTPPRTSPRRRRPPARAPPPRTGSRRGAPHPRRRAPSARGPGGGASPGERRMGGVSCFGRRCGPAFTRSACAQTSTSAAAVHHRLPKQRPFDLPLQPSHRPRLPHAPQLDHGVALPRPQDDRRPIPRIRDAPHRARRDSPPCKADRPPAFPFMQSPHGRFDI